MFGFAALYLGGQMVDYYNTYTPPGRSGRCYTLTQGVWQFKVKILENYQNISVIRFEDAPGRMVNMTYKELRDRNLKEVTCEKAN